ncbi:MAG: GNAT family N-acetyltransferase [Actinomycetota bacterium]
MEIVPFDGSEAAYRRRVVLLKEAQPEEPWSIEGERAADEADAVAGRPTCAFFAAAQGARLGFARAQTDPDVPVAGRRRIWVVVAHAVRRRGIGTALLDAVGEAGAARGATEFHVSTSLAEPDGLAFALARGFREVEAEYELHLDLGAFDPGGLALPDRVESLAALHGTHPDWFERYYRLHTAVEATVPWALGYAAPGREAFRRARLDAAEALAEGTMIAVVDGEWVGLCEMWRSGDDAHTVYEELTGVLPEYRGQGLGRALVAAAAGWARGRGYHRMLTSTSTANEAMQCLARRLGFRVAGRWSHLLGPALWRRVPSGREVGS